MRELCLNFQMSKFTFQNNEKQITDAYLEPCQTFRMECFKKQKKLTAFSR